MPSVCIPFLFLLSFIYIIAGRLVCNCFAKEIMQRVKMNDRLKQLGDFMETVKFNLIFKKN